MRLALVMLLSLAPAASTPNRPASDPQALTLAAQSIAAMTSGLALSDVTLTGNVTWIAGSEIETGTGNFLTKGGSQSRVDLGRL